MSRQTRRAAEKAAFLCFGWFWTQSVRRVLMRVFSLCRKGKRGVEQTRIKTRGDACMRARCVQALSGEFSRDIKDFCWFWWLRQGLMKNVHKYAQKWILCRANYVNNLLQRDNFWKMNFPCWIVFVEGNKFDFVRKESNLLHHVFGIRTVAFNGNES